LLIVPSQPSSFLADKLARQFRLLERTRANIDTLVAGGLLTDDAADRMGVSAPFPKLTSLDVGTNKGSSPTVWHNGRNQRVVAMQACHHFSAYGPAPSPLAWAPGLYSQTIFLASI